VRFDRPLMDENDREQAVRRVPPASPEKPHWLDRQLDSPERFGCYD
jgi:hypothetical protein